jgi:CRISPR-associated protein Cas8b1/Cst1 subtype I-B
MPDVDTLLNNPMFNKMLHNEELIKKMSDQTFQDKILSYQYNPFEVLKDKEIMSFMTSILTKKKN